MIQLQHLNPLLQELKQLKSEGVEAVYLSDAGRDILERWLSAGGRGGVDRPQPAPESGPSRETDSDASPRGTDSGASPRGTDSAALLGLKNAPADKPEKSPEKTPAVKEDAPVLPPPPNVELPDGDKLTQWNSLKEQVLGCATCNEQVKPGKKVVFGVGNVDADLFFCGEAPGAEEEVQGEPFVGPAGQLLTRIIGAMGLSRDAVYIANIMNWRPDTGNGHGNRPPTREEMDFCLPYLKAQLEIVQPRVIVALGGTAVRGLQGLDQNPRMRDTRGHWKEYQGIPLMVTYHPSYLLRNQSKKRKREVWEDMLMVMEKLDMPITEKQRGYFL